MFCDDMVNCLQANIELLMAVIATITSLEVHTASKIILKSWMYLRREHWHLQQRQTSVVMPSHVNRKPSQVNLNIANFQSPVSPIKNDILAQLMICNHIFITPAYTLIKLLDHLYQNVMIYNIGVNYRYAT